MGNLKKRNCAIIQNNQGKNKLSVVRKDRFQNKGAKTD